MTAKLYNINTDEFRDVSQEDYENLHRRALLGSLYANCMKHLQAAYRAEMELGVKSEIVSPDGLMTAALKMAYEANKHIAPLKPPYTKFPVA